MLEQRLPSQPPQSRMIDWLSSHPEVVILLRSGALGMNGHPEVTGSPQNVGRVGRSPSMRRVAETETIRGSRFGLGNAPWQWSAASSADASRYRSSRGCGNARVTRFSLPRAINRRRYAAVLVSCVGDTGSQFSTSFRRLSFRRLTPFWFAFPILPIRSQTSLSVVRRRCRRCPSAAGR